MPQPQKVYLDDQGNPIGAAGPVAGKVYLDEQGNPLRSTAEITSAVGDMRPMASHGAAPADHGAAAAIADMHARTDNATNLFKGWVREGPHRVVTGLKDVVAGNVAKGTHDIITGSGLTALPMVAPELALAIMAAPGAAAMTAGAGILVNQVAPPIAKAFGATPDQADVVADVAGMGTGTAVAKYGVPALARWSTTNKAVAMGKAYQQSTRDIQAALGVKAEDVHAARPFLEAVHAQGVPIVGKEDAAAQLTKAAHVAVDEIEQHVASVIAQFPRATAPAADAAVLAKVAQMPGSSASDLAAARAVIAEYGLDQPRSLPEAESLRIRLNAENRSVLEGTGVRQRTAALSNPTFVARQQAANSLRDGIYDTLEQHGVEGIRDLRRGEGAVLALRNAADPLTRGLRSESTVARTGETSFLRRMGRHALRAGGAAAGATLGGVPGAAVGAEVGNEIGFGLTARNMSRNALLERAFRQRFTSPPVMSVQHVQAASPSPRSLLSRSLPSGPRNTGLLGGSHGPIVPLPPAGNP